MKEKKHGAPSARRDFLKLATVGAVTGAALAVTGGEAKAAEEDTPTSSGYRETPHVKKAYEVSRF